MTYLRGIAAALLVLAVTSCMTTKQMPDNDQQVIRAVLDQLCRQLTHSDYYVLSSSSAMIDEDFTPGEIESSARRSLIDRNAQGEALPRVETCSSLHRVDQSQLNTDMQASMHDSKGYLDQWSAFYANFPGAQGIVRLSLPGYSEAGDFAVVQVLVACGDVCSSASFWVLKRVNDQWQISNSVAGPVS